MFDDSDNGYPYHPSALSLQLITFAEDVPLFSANKNSFLSSVLRFPEDERLKVLKQHDRYYERILVCLEEESDRDEVRELLKESLSECEAFFALYAVESIIMHHSEWLSLYNTDEFVKNGTVRIDEMTYKQLVQIYHIAEELLLHAMNIIERIDENRDNISDIQVSNICVILRNMNEYLLLYLRVVLFDLPLAYDSLWTLANIWDAQGLFYDDERAIAESGRVYSRLTPFILNYVVTDVVHGIHQEVMRTLKEELSNKEYIELKQKSVTQPTWLQKPKWNYR